MVTLANAIREFKKKNFQISAVRTGVRACMDATPLLFRDAHKLDLGYMLDFTKEFVLKASTYTASEC